MKGEPTQARDIARRQGISQRYLEQIFQKLKKAGIMSSQRGPKGGYYLIKEPEEITIGDIIRAAEGPIELVFCTAQGPRKKCSREEFCVTTPFWTKLSERISEAFDDVSISDLCDKGQELGIKKLPKEDYMYHI